MIVSNRAAGDQDNAIVKFDKNWNMVDRKQYGYPDKDDEGNFFQPISDGFGESLTQGRDEMTFIYQIFYSESDDKIYARGRDANNPSGTMTSDFIRGKYFNENVDQGGLGLTFDGVFRVIKIEPSDLSVVNVKWPIWTGKVQDSNALPTLDYTDFVNNGFTAPFSMSPDGKYIYSIVQSWNKAYFGDYPLNNNTSFRHYMNTPFYDDSTDGFLCHNVVRYNIESEEFDMSWSILPLAWEQNLPQYLGNRLIPGYGFDQSWHMWPRTISSTENGFVATFATNFGSSYGGTYPTDEVSNCVVVRASDDERPYFHFGLTDTDEVGSFIQGAMISANGRDSISTWTEPTGFFTSNERYWWDEPEGWTSSSNGQYFYTYYPKTGDRPGWFNARVHLGHKFSDLIGESYKAYDQDNFIDSVIEWKTSDSVNYTAKSYPKPFYRLESGLPTGERDRRGGDGGLRDEMPRQKAYRYWLGTEDESIVIDDAFSGRSLLPPLPETDHHVFYSPVANLTWSDLPTSDPDNGSLEIDGTTTDRDFYESQDKTFYRYKAIFDWDASVNGGWNAEIYSVERFGLNSQTGQRNQIVNGYQAFQCLLPYALGLMHYHGETLHLQDETHKWDRCGPAFRTLDTSNLTDMSYMFAYTGGKPVSGPTLSSWDTSNVTNMEGMFEETYAGSQQLELRWDTSSVTNMSRMFYNYFRAGDATTSVVDMRTWDFSNVTTIDDIVGSTRGDDFGSLLIVSKGVSLDQWPDFNGAIPGTYTCLDLTKYLKEFWGDLNVNVLGYEGCSFYPAAFTVMVTNREITDDDLPMWGSSNVPSDTKLELVDQYETSTRAARYVYQGIFPWNNDNNNGLLWLEDVVQFGGNQLEDGRGAFNSAPITRISAFDSPNFSVSNLTDFTYMFRYCSNFNQDLTNWDTGNATQMYQMFGFCDVFNGDVTNFDLSNCDDIGGMFRECFAFNQDISGWNTSSATKAFQTFYQATSFNQDLSEWCVRGLPSEPTDFSTGATSWTLPKPVWGTCPRNEDGSNDDFFHIFVANSNAIRLPVEDDADVKTCLVDDVEKDYATEVAGQTFSGSTIKAEFDWDNQISRYSLNWIESILQFGFNSVTGEYNQVKNGAYAFK